MQEPQQFQLSYENTLDDAVALTKHYYKNSRTHVRTRRIALTIVMLWLLGCNLLIYGVEWLPYALLYTAIDIAIMFTLGLGLRWIIGDRLIRRQFSADKNRSFLGAHDLQVTDEGLIHRTAYSESKMAWGMIERIESTKDHTLIYVGTGSALIIPHERITGGDYASFMQELGQRFKPDQPLLHSGEAL